MSIFNFWKSKDKRIILTGGQKISKSKPPYASKIQEELPISCICKQILSDLDIKNLDKWKYDGLMTFGPILTNGKYSIGFLNKSIYINDIFVEKYSPYLCSFTYNFNRSEQELFDRAGEKLYTEFLKREKEKFNESNKKKLKQLFSECYD